MGTNLELTSIATIVPMHAGLQITRGATRHLNRVLPFFDLIFVREGILPIQEDDQEFLVKAGQTLLLWPNRRHRGTAPSPPNSRLYWLHFDLNEQTVTETYSPPEDNLQILSVPQYATMARPEFLESLFRRYLDDAQTGRLVPSFATALIWLMLHEIADQRPVVRSERTAAVVAGRALTYIRSHSQSPITVAKISEELGYNPDYLNRAFLRAFGHTLSQEIQISRVGYASHLLLYSKMSVKEIALASGFTEMSHFARVFKRHRGMTASEFRRLNALTFVNFD